jgi:hypothetical protein
VPLEAALDRFISGRRDESLYHASAARDWM